MVTKCLLCFSAVGTLIFDTGSSTASVEEGDEATVCISISSATATDLGFDLIVSLTTVDGKAVGEISHYP